ncbi:MAG: glycosyltransferase family 4 protein [Verrucomicrobiales bacterium]|nr:glycosyltransferase family 4 protein [Verrucomicrobiales bacterium]
MKIAYVCADPGVPVFGRKGCSIHVQEVIRALRGRGAEVELFAVRTGGEAPADLREVRVHRLRVAPSEGDSAREQALLAANAGWREQFEQAGPFDAWYERYSLWSCAAMEYARECQLPALLEVNAPLIEEQAAHRGLIDAVGAQDTARRAFRSATSLLAVSEEVGRYLEGFREAEGKVEVIANGVNVERFALALEQRRARAVQATGTTVGFVGTLKPWHGTDLLVEAFAGLAAREAEARLLIVGDGPERSHLEAQVASLGLASQVHFTGSVQPEEVPGWLAAMDIAAAPYPGLDHFYFSPLKVYEYMAAGLPVVASRIGQLENLVQDGETGCLVAPGEVAALAEALVTLSRDPALRERLGTAARRRVEARHTWSAVAERILQRASRIPAPAFTAGDLVLATEGSL